MESHAGTTPMERRRDALVGAAELIVECRKHRQPAQRRATIGLIQSQPQSRNTIPGRVFFTVDFRHPEDAELTKMDADLRAAAADIAERHRPRRQDQGVLVLPAVALRPGARRRGARAGRSRRAIRTGHHQRRRPRRRLHRRVAPTAMIFVPCKDGISHNEIEDANKTDIGAGAQILLQAMVEEPIREIRSGLDRHRGTGRDGGGGGRHLARRAGGGRRRRRHAGAGKLVGLRPRHRHGASRRCSSACAIACPSSPPGRRRARALIASTSGVPGFRAAVGAFVLAAVLILLTAAIRPLGRLIERIPASIAAAMLAGILLRLVIAMVEHVPSAPLLVLSLIALFLVARRLMPTLASLVVLVAGALLAVALGLVKPLPPLGLSHPELGDAGVGPRDLGGAGRAALSRHHGVTEPAGLRRVARFRLSAADPAGARRHRCGVAGHGLHRCPHLQSGGDLGRPLHRTGGASRSRPALEGGRLLCPVVGPVALFGASLVGLFAALPPALLATVARPALLGSMAGAMGALSPPSRIALPPPAPWPSPPRASP